MSYWLHPAAEAEIAAAARYYAEHASLVIAQAYIQEFERVAEVIVNNQQFGTPLATGLRKYPFRRFPYTVFYRENLESGPRIYAVAHQRREPGYWAQKPIA